MNRLNFFLFLLIFISGCASPRLKRENHVTAPLIGVTVDSIENLAEIKQSLQALSKVPTVRVVFDIHVPPSFYSTAVRELHEISYVMGGLVDSYQMKSISPAAFELRAREYFKVLSPWVDIWEIGNEINGEWLGPIDLVVQKMKAAFAIATEFQEPTALTLFFNETCFSQPEAEVFAWTDRHVPIDMRSRIDYVLFSYYEDDCNGFVPDWEKAFSLLSRYFPNSWLGFGEVGSKFPERKTAVIQRYYGMPKVHPKFIGGYFWWYFNSDMVPMSKPLWKVLNKSIR